MNTCEAQVFQGLSAWTDFFPSKDSSEEDRKSSFLVFDRSGMHPMSKEADAHYYATHTLDTFVIMRVEFELREFVTVRWNSRTGIFVAYEEEEVKQTELLRSNSTFQHDLSHFQYAGRLKKSSFSPMLPYSSTLTGKLLAKPKVRSPKGRKSAGSQNAEGMVNAVCRFMQRGGETLAGMKLSVVESMEGRWYLINISDILWSSSPTVQPTPLPPLKPSSPLQSSPVSTQRSSLKDWDLCSSLKRVPYIDLKEIQQSSIQLYDKFNEKRAHHRSLTVIEHCKQPILPVEEVEEIVRKLDRKHGDLKRQKEVMEDHRKLQLAVNENPGHMQKLVMKGYYACLKDEDLKKFFKFSETLTVSHLSGLFEQAITSVHNGGLAKRIQAVHGRLGITDEQFTRFLSLFTEAMRKELCESDVELITRQMLRYKGEIVTA